MAAQKNGKETAIHEWASWKNRGHTESWVGVGKTEEGLMLSFQGAYERKLGFRWLASRPIVKRAGEEAGKSPCRAATTGELNLPSLGATGHGESRRRQLGEPSGNHAKRPRAAARLVHLWAGIHRLVGARQPPPAALVPALRAASWRAAEQHDHVWGEATASRWQQQHRDKLCPGSSPATGTPPNYMY